MTPAAVAAASIAAALALTFGCAPEQSEPPHAAPAQPRAALLLEPPVLPIGGVADVVLAVVTRPEWSVRPDPPPSDLLGFAWLGREPTEVVREPARWIHRTRMRIRALDVGSFTFPGGSVEVVSPEGKPHSLDYEPLSFEVLSGLGDAPSRSSPFGVRLLPRPAGSRGALLGAFAAGAGLSLACLGLFFLARRRLSEPLEPRTAAPAVIAPWEWASAELSLARASIETDPRSALDAAARTLRSYVVRRFGGDVEARTTPELEIATPPFALTTRWRGLVELLADLDAARFPSPPPPEVAVSQAVRLVDAVVDFIEATTPAESR